MCVGYAIHFPNAPLSQLPLQRWVFWSGHSINSLNVFPQVHQSHVILPAIPCWSWVLTKPLLWPFITLKKMQKNKTKQRQCWGNVFAWQFVLRKVTWMVRATWPPVNSPLIERHFPHPHLQGFSINISSSRAYSNTFLKSKTDSTSFKYNSHITKCTLFKWTVWCVLTNVYPSLITKTNQNVLCFHQSKVFSCVSLKSIPFHHPTRPSTTPWQPLICFSESNFACGCFFRF